MDGPETTDAGVLALPLRWVFLALAIVFLALAVIGAFLPILPSVPFLLLSAWAAARGSPRLLAWLESHPHFGRVIREWRQGGVVGRRAKWQATALMLLSAVIILLTVRKPWAAGLAIGCMAAVLAWLWRRPEGPVD